MSDALDRHCTKPAQRTTQSTAIAAS